MNENPNPRSIFPGARHGLILLIYGAYLTNPAWHSGYVIGRDTLIHLLWSSNFTDQFWSGELYPRWLSRMNEGLGSPAFFFYAPLPYYLTALMRPLFDLAAMIGLTIADPQGWHQLGLSAALAIILSGFTVYLWVSTFANKTAALLAAIFYMCSPFHLAIDLYQRFGFGELWAFVWLPLILLMVKKLGDRSIYAFTTLALCYAALILTHLPTTLIFSLVPIIYPIWFSAKNQRLKNMLRTISAMSLGVGLAAIYFIPAMMTQEYVSFAEMRKYYMHYSDNFLYWGPRFNADMTKFIGFLSEISTPMIIICCFSYLFLQRQNNEFLVHQGKFWLLLSVGSLFMMLPVSEPLWNNLQLLQVIQFPWRFHVVLTFTTTAMFALWMQVLEADFAWWKCLLAVLVGVVLISQFLPTLNMYQTISGTEGEPSFKKMLEQFGTRNEEANDSVLAAMISKDVPEYRPRWVSREFLYDPESIRIQVEQTKNDRIKDQVEISLNEPRRITLHSKAASRKWITIEHLYYPGWVAQLSNEIESGLLEVRPSTPEGLLQILVPPGQHDIRLTLEASKEERLGGAISLASLVVLLGLFYREWRSSKSQLPVNA